MDSALRARLEAVLGAYPGLVAAWVFGSVARGDERADSDVDVAVLLGRGDRPQRLSDLPLDLEAALAEAVGREVDLVALDWAPVDLIHRVLRDGVLVLERDKGARIRFEVDARNRYFDLLPVLREYRRTAP
ncbi:MAG: nucleotidyltransferase domain-containing protein [Sandaracinaceae bacterium]|nr:nucleotidyltransferase domain-containing protein [Sandaracinaceae bacterium]